MKTQTITRRLTAGIALFLAALAAGCGLENPEAPSLIGPAEFGLSVTMTASPDILPRDGSSQSIVTFTVRDEHGRPVAGQRLTLVNTGGRLSQTEVVTGADGRAIVAVTAPAATDIGPNVITIGAVPFGTNFDNSEMRTLTIALTGQSNTAAPNALFSFTPTAPEVRQPVTFNAGNSTDEGRTCGTTCTFAWNFGDGTTATGVRPTKTFNTPGQFTVSLTVTDPVGLTSTTQQVVTVTSPAAPTVTAAVSPSPPLIDQQATFTATATPATGRQIVRYEWNFGDGSTATTTAPTVTKTYNRAGSFVAVVAAYDDLGNAGQGSTSFTIGTGITPSITFSPTNPTVGQEVNYSAAGTTTTSGATITGYLWDFGDGDTSTAASPTNTYPSARTYVIRLTVTDSRGRTATTTSNITVSP